MTILRKEALVLSSFLHFLSLSSKEKETTIENAFAEGEIVDATEEVSNYYGRKYIEYNFKYYSNSYLQSYLSSKLKSPTIVTGKSPKLYVCPCCNYKALKRRGQYDICRVCFWEDDGGLDLFKYSSANRMTLSDAKTNFEKIGIVSDQFLNDVHTDRFSQYDKSI